MIKICASGEVTPMGNSEDEIWTNLKNGTGGRLDRKLDYSSRLKRNVKRRSSRFSDLAAAAAVDCFDRLSESYPVSDRNRVGCILSTDYGPLESNLEFAKQLEMGDPDLCSPILFSNTVHNACLGTIAIHLGITGPNTMLMGSNHMRLSEMMLREKKADYMLTGAVEEYNDELKKSLGHVNMIPQSYCDASVVFAISDSDEKKGARVAACETRNFGLNPFNADSAETKELECFLEEKLDQYDPDAVILNHPLSPAGKSEERVISRRPEITRINRYYQYFGNALGADMTLKILVAKIILERQEIPACLTEDGNGPRGPERIAVCGTDITGNYYFTVLD